MQCTLYFSLWHKLILTNSICNQTKKNPNQSWVINDIFPFPNYHYFPHRAKDPWFLPAKCNPNPAFPNPRGLALIAQGGPAFQGGHDWGAWHCARQRGLDHFSPPPWTYLRWSTIKSFCCSLFNVLPIFTLILQSIPPEHAGQSFPFSKRSCDSSNILIWF